MDRTNSKLITSSFALFAFIIAVTIKLLLKAFAGAFGIVARLMEGDVIPTVLPVVVGLGIFFALQLNSRTVSWADEVITEVRKITWPVRKDVIAMTIAVIVMVLISSVIISGFDFMSTELIKVFVG